MTASRALPGRFRISARNSLAVDRRPHQDRGSPFLDRTNTDRSSKDKERNTTDCNRSIHTGIPIPSPNTASQSQNPIRNRSMDSSSVHASRNRRANRSRHGIRRSIHARRNNRLRGNRRCQCSHAPRHYIRRHSGPCCHHGSLRHRRRGNLHHRDHHHRAGQKPSAANCQAPGKRQRQEQFLGTIGRISSFQFPCERWRGTVHNSCIRRGESRRKSTRNQQNQRATCSPTIVISPKHSHSDPLTFAIFWANVASKAVSVCSGEFV